MGYVIPPGFSRVTFEHDPVNTLGSAPVWGFGCSGDPDDDLVSTVQAWWEDDFQDLVSEAYVLKRIAARNDVELAERVVSLGGGRTNADCQPQVAALIKMTSGLVGRKNRGRIYWPGVLPEANVSGAGAIEESYRSQLQDAFEALGTALEGLARFAVILHNDSSDPTPVSSAAVQTQVATQRRRMRS